MNTQALQIALMGPQAAQAQRQFGNRQMLEGTSGAPVGHWTQALNRALQGAVGGLRESQVRDQEQQAATLSRDALAKALAGGSLEDSATMLMGNPATQDMGVRLAQSAISQRQQTAQAADSQKEKLAAEERAHARAKELLNLRLGYQNKNTAAPASYDPGYYPGGINENGDLILTGYSQDVPGQGGRFMNVADGNPDGALPDFGQRNLSPSDVPGVVVTPQGASDQFATRELQAQKAFSQTSNEDQDRLRRHVATQRMWTTINGKAPAGKIYAPNGTLIDLSEKAPIDLKAAMPRAKQALSLLNKAEETLKDMTYAGRAYQIWDNAGAGGQAAKDIQQAGMQIVYMLSGKQTSAAEMKMFLDTYAIDPRDTDWRITEKVGRVKAMLQGIVDGVASGMTYDEAFAKAQSSIFEREQKPDDLSGMSDDDLLRQLGAQ